MRQQIRTRSMQRCLVGLLVGVLACGNRDDTTAPTGNGTIVLTLSTPDGITPAVTITGPNGFSRSVSTTTTLLHLAAGSYSIFADSIVTPGALVGFRIDTAAVTGNPIVVSSTGSSAASVSYAFARIHGAMWMANGYGPHPTGLAPSQLDTSAIVGAADTIGGAPNTSGVAIDAHGNMWVSQWGTTTLQMYTALQRAAHGTPTPAMTLTSPAFSQPGRMNFDSQGTLWVADYYNGLIGFSSAQLAAGGGAVQPMAIVSDTTRGFAGPTDVAFDASGNAWVAEAWNENLVKYTPAMLAASGSPAPSVRIGATGASPRIVRGVGSSRLGEVAFSPVTYNLQTPLVLAFDSHGSLWVGNYGGAKITAYGPAQLTSSADPAPGITLTGDIDYPVGLAFDRAGNLWVSDDDAYTVSRFNASLLGASAVVAASVVLESDDFDDPQQIVFDQWVVASTPPPVQTSRTHSARAPSRVSRRAIPPA